MNARTIDLAMEIQKLSAMATEGGELTPEMIADTLEGIEGMLEDKFDATMSVIRQFDSQADYCSSEAARLAERKKHWDRQSFALRKYLLECLITANRPSLKTTLNTFTARKGSLKLVIDSVDLLPDDFVEAHTEVVLKPLNDQIKQRLKDAQIQIAEFEKQGKAVPDEIKNAVPGAHLETGPQSLQVR